MTKNDIQFMALKLANGEDVVIKSSSGMFFKISNKDDGFLLTTLSDIENEVILSERFYKSFNDLLVKIASIKGKFI